jgi:L-asparaginase II
MQALVALESGAADRFGFSSEDIAIIASSHSGAEEHTERVSSILERAGLDASALQCGRHPPFDEAAAQRLGDGYTALNHNCSGKHAGMLATCVHMGWDTTRYLRPEHPLQQRILADVRAETGVPDAALTTATDGCGVPTFAMPLRHAARAFARLSEGPSVSGPRGESLGRIRDAMLAHPRLVAGRDRIDTRIMTALKGRVWVKAGAEAFYAAGTLKGPHGIALKIEDGGPRAVGPTLTRILEILGEEPASLAATAREAIRNHAGDVVGEIRPAF